MHTLMNGKELKVQRLQMVWTTLHARERDSNQWHARGPAVESSYGYALDERMRASLGVRALRNAIRLRDPQSTIVHSDRGSISVQGFRPRATQ